MKRRSGSSSEARTCLAQFSNARGISNALSVALAALILLVLATVPAAAVTLVNADSALSSAEIVSPTNSVTVDFTGNRPPGILWRNQVTGQNAIWNLNGGIVAKTALIGGTTSNWRVVGSGDFNGDGKADVLWREADGHVAVWLMNDTTIATSSVIAMIPTTWNIAGTGDFDGDGKTDVLWRASDGTVAMWLMDGMTIKNRAVLLTVPTTWIVTGIGDLNGDGKADIVWSNSDGTVATWLMNGFTLSASNLVGAVSPPWSIVAGPLHHRQDSVGRSCRYKRALSSCP